MKNGIILSLSLLFFTLTLPQAYPNPVEALKCRTAFTDIKEDLPLVEKIRLDLVQGIWVKDQETLLQFTPLGKADLLTSDASGNYRADRYSWLIEMRNNEAFLLFSNRQTGANQQYKLNQTCQGIELTNLATGALISLKFYPIADSNKLQALKASLSGRWENTLYPFDVVRNSTNSKKVEDAFLKYEFRQDGTYSKIFGNQYKKIEEEGHWEISLDGNFLIMHPIGNEAGNNVLTTQFAQIKYLQMDEMVLEHALKSTESSFCTDRKDFYFNKQ